MAYLTEALIHGACSMAFLRDSDLHPIDDTVFEKLPYTRDRLCILMPSDHPKASQKSVSLPELSEEEFVILNQGHPAAHILVANQKTPAVRKRAVITTATMTAMTMSIWTAIMIMTDTTEIPIMRKE